MIYFPSEHHDFPMAMLDDQSIPWICSLFKGPLLESFLHTLMRPVAAKGVVHNPIFV